MKFRISKDIEGQFVERVYIEHFLKEINEIKVDPMMKGMGES